MNKNKFTTRYYICSVIIFFEIYLNLGRYYSEMSKQTQEPLLADNPNRYVMFPLREHDIWSLYKKMFDCLWRPEEIDFSKDMAHWRTLTEQEQYFIKMILAFFAASDGIVVENLGTRFLSEVQLPEARAAYGISVDDGERTLGDLFSSD